jgi:hypothetical protein
MEQMARSEMMVNLEQVLKEKSGPMATWSV